MIDKRGERVDLKVYPTNGLTHTFTLNDDNGSAIDITGYSFSVTTSDDDGVYDAQQSVPTRQKTYSVTITDASNGQFSWTVPASDLSNKWGEQINYGIQKTVSGETSEAFWGVLKCEQLR